MRSIFTLLLFCVLGTTVKAQVVELPNYTFYLSPFPMFNSSCVFYDSSANMFLLDTFCSKETSNVYFTFKKNDKKYDSDELLQFLKYFTTIDTLSIYIALDEQKEETVNLNFSEIKSNPTAIWINVTKGGQVGDNSSRKELVVNNIPESVKELRIETAAFNKYDIDKWPVGLKSLRIREDYAENDFLLNKAIPAALDDLTLELNFKDISAISLPSSLKQLRVSALNFEYNRLNNIQNLEIADINNSYSDVTKTVDLDINNSFLKMLRVAGWDDSIRNVSFHSPKLDIRRLPDNIESLAIGGYELDEQDNLGIPVSVKNVDLSYLQNSDEFINSLPDHIQILSLYSDINNVKKFPKKLRTLVLDGLTVTTLPVFPEGLDSLMLSQLDSLTCLPLFPENLKYFEAWDIGNIECIPNETKFFKATEEWPVCTDFQYICDVDEHTIVEGTLYYDLNKNGIKDAGDIPVSGGVLSLNEETFATANKDGVYWLILREQGTFEIKAISNHPQTLATLPAVKTIVYDENYVNDSVHFLIQVDDVKDLKITGTNLVARPGMYTAVTAFTENLGVIDLSDVTVKIKKPQDWSVESATPAGYRTDNDTIIWENVNLGKLSNSSFKVQTQLPATATILGNPYQYEMWVSSASQEDVTPSDNYYKIIDTIIGSYDPNDKIVNYTSLTPENSNAQELVYTIRFQNTGTDTAFKVIVVDTIIGNLDPTSIRVLGASHDFTWEYTGQGIAAFTFDNILLPDSNVNEPASHGFVTLAVKANKDLAVGDSIYNRAGIYFDFNEPVITNKALTRIATVTSVYTHANTSLKIYPNPAKDRVRVEWSSNERATLRLLDISGKLIQSQTLNQNYSDIDVSRLSKGMYLIQVQSAEGISVGKLLIQ